MQEHTDDNELQLPAELVRELKARDVAQPFVPDSVDEAVLSRARKQFDQVAQVADTHDRGEDSGLSGKRLPGQGAGETRKVAFWGRTALAGVGSVAAALALAALLTTGPGGWGEASAPSSMDQLALAPADDHAAGESLSDFYQFRGTSPSAPAMVRKLEARQARGRLAESEIAGEMADSLADADMTMHESLEENLAVAKDGTTSGFSDQAADSVMSGRAKVAAKPPMEESTAAAPASNAPFAEKLNGGRRNGAAGISGDDIALDRAAPAATPAPGDVNRSGQVDILDVYLLARRRELGDKAITQANIDALAAQVVRLARREGGSL